MYFDLFFNEMAFPFQPEKFKIVMQSILSGYDNLEGKSVETINEFSPYFCISNLENYAKERGIERYISETDDDYQLRISQAFLYFQNGFTKSGIIAMISKITLKTFTITEKFTGYFRISSSKIGLSARISNTDFSGYIVSFYETITEEERMKITNTLDLFSVCGIKYVLMEG